MVGASNDRECVLSSAIAEETFSEQTFLFQWYKLTHRAARQRQNGHVIDQSLL